MKRFKWIESHPVEAVIFVISIALTILAVNILGPWYIQVADASTIAQGIPGRLPEQLLGSFFLLTSVPGMIAPFNKKIPNVWLEWGTMGLFMSFLFMGILRVVVYGWVPFTWVTILAVAIVCGLLRIYLRSHRT